MQQRLQKLISTAGIASRRHAEELITSGQVNVNGKIVTELGAKADPATDHIKVKGRLINPLLRRLKFTNCVRQTQTDGLKLLCTRVAISRSAACSTLSGIR